MKLTVNVDGGARGNPGPSAIGIVVRDETGGVLLERGEKIGDATNNVAEYKALIAGIALAKELGADKVELIGDSELVVKQVRGEYKVKNAGIKPLHAEAKTALADFDEWTIKHVRREMNSEADRLVNEVLDG
ncbi:MAG: ribonuclease HI family protein [Thermoleophilia bacterium]|nr:ribonuclease HI family protein [Thermoleophilia bacterium]